MGTHNMFVTICFASIVTYEVLHTFAMLYNLFYGLLEPYSLSVFIITLQIATNACMISFDIRWGQLMSSYYEWLCVTSVWVYFITIGCVACFLKLKEND